VTFKLLRPRRHRRPRRKPLPPQTFAAVTQFQQGLRRKAARQTSRPQTLLRLACVREITTRKPLGKRAELCPAAG
jgi:hypothetical protein